MAHPDDNAESRINKALVAYRTMFDDDMKILLIHLLADAMLACEQAGIEFSALTAEAKEMLITSGELPPDGTPRP